MVIIRLPLVLTYLLPSLVAIARGHRSWFEIITCNLLLGWTVLGWLVALVTHGRSLANDDCFERALLKGSSD
jgi:hypothetical protein